MCVGCERKCGSVCCCTRTHAPHTPTRSQGARVAFCRLKAKAKWSPVVGRVCRCVPACMCVCVCVPWQTEQVLHFCSDTMPHWLTLCGGCGRPEGAGEFADSSSPRPLPMTRDDALLVRFVIGGAHAHGGAHFQCHVHSHSANLRVYTHTHTHEKK